MTRLIRKLWDDDQGALIATEFLFFATILVFGVVVGLTTVRNAIVSELTELAQAITAVDQTYTYSGITGCGANVDGSATDDIIAGPVPPSLLVAPVPTIVDDDPCT